MKARTTAEYIYLVQLQYKFTNEHQTQSANSFNKANPLIKTQYRNLSFHPLAKPRNYRAKQFSPNDKHNTRTLPKKDTQRNTYDPTTSFRTLDRPLQIPVYQINAEAKVDYTISAGFHSRNKERGLSLPFNWLYRGSEKNWLVLSRRRREFFEAFLPTC